MSGFPWFVSVSQLSLTDQERSLAVMFLFDD